MPPPSRPAESQYWKPGQPALLRPRTWLGIFEILCILAAAAATGYSAATHQGTVGSNVTQPIEGLQFPSTITAGPPAVEDMQAIYAILDQAPFSGFNCFSVDQSTSPLASTCPVTPRLQLALDVAITNGLMGGGKDSICDCVDLDPTQVVTYSMNSPPGDGTIHVRAFGGPHVNYIVVPTTRGYLVDDIVYCQPAPHSIYPSEKVSGC